MVADVPVDQVLADVQRRRLTAERAEADDLAPEAKPVGEVGHDRPADRVEHEGQLLPAEHTLQLGRQVIAVDHDAVAARDADLRRGMLAAHHVERMNPGALGEADDVLAHRRVRSGLRDPVALGKRPEQT